MYKVSRTINPNARLIPATSKYFGLTQGNKKADSLMEEFFKATNKEFNDKAYISEEELKQIYKKILPGISLEFKNSPSQKGSVASKAKDQDGIYSVLGHIISLPFTTLTGKKIIPIQEKEAIFHETSHLIDFVVKPKFKVKTILSPQIRNKAQIFWDFYNSKLYYKIEGENKTPQKEQLKQLKDDFKEMFKSANCNSYEKIEILQNFRYKLKTEQTAFINGLFYSLQNKKPSKEQEKIIRENIKNTVNKKHSFDIKITLIEDLLKIELGKTRKKHAQKWSKKLFTFFIHKKKTA